MTYKVGEKVIIGTHTPGLKGKEGTIARVSTLWSYVVEINGTEYEFGEYALRRVGGAPYPKPPGL